MSYGPDVPLTQVSSSLMFSTSRGPLEGSPGALEMGLAGSTTELMASPFHSQKIQTEVQLRKFRPASLDADGRRAGLLTESEGDLDNSGKGPRVARVDTREDENKRSPEVPTPRSLVAPSSSGAEPSGALSLQSQAARGATDDRTSEPRTPREGEASMALVLAEGLIPAGSGQMDAMIFRILEENQLLKRRLEILESAPGRKVLGGSGLEMLAHLPVSFAPEEVSATVVQSRRSRGAVEDLLRVIWGYAKQGQTRLRIL